VITGLMGDFLPGKGVIRPGLEAAVTATGRFLRHGCLLNC
jgi:hypothetical protein